MTAKEWAVLCYCVGLLADVLGVVATVKAGYDARNAILSIDTTPTMRDLGHSWHLTGRDSEVRTALTNQQIIW
jgi:hypothetical protein